MKGGIHYEVMILITNEAEIVAIEEMVAIEMVAIEMVAIEEMAAIEIVAIEMVAIEEI